MRPMSGGGWGGGGGGGGGGGRGVGVCVLGVMAPPNNEILDIWVIFHNLNKRFVI